MAKKKATQNQERQEENTLKPHNKDPKPTMTVNNVGNEAASVDKLESLKSLNRMLLKEAVERREQVASLKQAKGCLESELSRSNSENKGLMSELTQLSESFFRLEMERDVVCSFVEIQVGQQGEAIEREMDGFWGEKVEIEKKVESLEKEMRDVLREKNEIEKANKEKDGEIEALSEKVNGYVNEIGKERDVSERVNRERDEMRVKLDLQFEEAKGLKMKLIETEKREKGIKKEVKELEVKYKGMMEKKEENERRINAITREKDSIERSLVEANRLIEEMKGKVEGIVREKEGIEAERTVEKTKRIELERAVSELNETVLSLQKEEVRLRDSVAKLEKKCVEGVEKQKEMGREIDELVGEKKESEKRQERLVKDKGLVEHDLNEALKRLDGQKLKIVELVSEKIKLTEDKDTKESIILDLQKQLEEFRVAIQKLENSCQGQIEKIKNLESEIGHYQDELKQITVERDEAKKGFNKEKQNGLALKVKSEEMKKKIEQNLKLVEDLQADNVKLIAKKEELGSLHEMLKKKLASTENALAEMHKELDVATGKVELVRTDSERLVSMLRSTAEFICSKDEKYITDGGKKEVKGKGTEPYVAEMELIKNAFENKEKTVEDMKKQLVLLQNSVVEAQKKKSFCTLLSSATTLVAAISLAYIARGR